MLDNNTLMLGEGVLLGAEVGGNPYIFGSPIPEDTNVYSIIAPPELKGVSIIADKILSPSLVWIAGQTALLKNGRLFFYGNPFSSYPANVTEITLWCYNAAVDTNNLWNNLGCLYGINVNQDEAGKAILASMTKLITQGASIQNITDVCQACVGSGTVEVVDNGLLNNWWRTEFTAGPAGSPLPFYLPPQVFTVGYRSVLKFVNSSEPISLVNGIINFPVQGCPEDVQLFTKTISANPAFLAGLEKYLGYTLTSAMINPVDFIFKSVFASSAVLIKVSCPSLTELAMFETVLHALQNNLPKYLMLIFVCEVTAANEVYQFAPSNVSDAVRHDAGPFPTPLSDHAYMNSKSGAGLLVQDMLLSRSIPDGITTLDFRNLSITKLPA